MDLYTDLLKQSFIETLTHDIKTPIVAQIRALELVLNENFGQLTNAQKEILKLTLDSSQYIHEMILTLVASYRFNETELNYSQFNIIEIIENSVQQVEKFLQSNHIKLVIIPNITTPFIEGDIVRIQKVIQTLLFNSLNSAFKNSIMKIFIDQNDDKISVKIESRSGHIKPDKMEKMFQICTSQKFDKIGTGIGLFMAKQIIEKHKGKIIAQSLETQKITFGFEIPQKEILYYEKCI